MSRAVGIVTTVLVVTIVAAACNPSSTDVGSPASDGVGGPLSDIGVGFMPFAGAGRRSVLVGFFDAAEGTSASEAEVDAASWAAYTETLTVCMRELGFEFYTYPHLPEEGSDAAEPVDGEGLGVVVDPGDTVPSRDEVVAAARRAEDQNATYATSLDGEARREYDLALEGFDATEGPPPGGEGSGDILSDEEKYMWATGGPGCRGKATRVVDQMYEDYYAQAELDEGMDDVLLDRLGGLLEQYVAEVEADAEIQDVLGAYQTCMITAGWRVGLPESALELLYEPPRELVELLVAEGSDLLTVLEAGDVPLDDPQVQELRRQEVEARRAHEQCVGPAIDAVFDFDERFAEENRDLLGQYITSGG